VSPMATDSKQISLSIFVFYFGNTGSVVCKCWNYG
jgi:hypothetical protein